MKDILQILDCYHVPDKLKNIIRSYLIEKKVMINDVEFLDYNI